MEKREPIKISLNVVIAIISIIIIAIIGIAIYVYPKVANNKKTYQASNTTSSINNTQSNIVSKSASDDKLMLNLTQQNVSEENTNSQKDYEELTSSSGEKSYRRLTKNTWNGEYHKDSYLTEIAINTVKVISYEDYLKYIEELNSKVTDKKISNYYTNKDSNYIILNYSTGHSWCSFDLIDCIEEKNKIIIYGDESSNGVMASGSGYLVVIPTNMPVGTQIDYRECNSNENSYSVMGEPLILKPIIYLYPTEDTNVTVKLGNPELATCVYPKYDYTNGWKVLAKTNGDLVDLNTNRNLYALYYESDDKYKAEVKEDGFVIKGSESAQFLEEKLEILGLTEREAEEFIVYWLPRLEANKYNYIRFATLDEINANMPLEINPNPDTLIRILMTFKGLENPIDVKEQQLTSPKREGFVAVEWGGTEIK